ncbi:MAG: hypothetical protein A2046_02750 [Bacteroidetes bacterium GWA2_30_7]|nr:MAG: hypothetical protein A2046_02750 [Bacteroidetes bacterium GWA2_30_7]
MLFLTNISKLDISIENTITNTFLAFLMGLRFDNVIMAYIISVPFLLFSLFHIFNKTPANTIISIIKWYLSLLLIVSFLICSIDIPYFIKFYTRFSFSALSWLDNGGFVLGMIFSDFSLWIYILPFILIVFLFLVVSKKIIKSYKIRVQQKNTQTLTIGFRILIFIAFSFLIFISIRGRTTIKSPIREGTAFFCDNTFLNYLGLNPVFTTMSSLKVELKNKKLQLDLITDSDAIKYLKDYYSDSNIDTLLSPICRNITAKNSLNKKNVIIIIMESMSANNTRQYKGDQSLTPFLDSLADNSIYFSNAYSTGIHTYNGIYSTLFSYPSIPKFHPMKSLIFEPHQGLANILKVNDYYNIFFINHDEQFDNIGGFLSANGYNRIVSEKNFKSEDIKGTMGVPDHILFSYAVDELNKISKNNKAFLSVFMTSSNHLPYVLPDDIKFKPKSKDIESQMIEYSDWAISNFFNNAKFQSWFDNTIFVLMGDHGNCYDGTYEIPISYVHCPLIFHNSGFENEENTKIASQTDIAPTVLGLLGINYQNNTMGFDLFNESRPYAYFSNEDFIGCIDNEFLLISRFDKSSKLYKYKNNSTTNLIENFRSKADSMQKFTFSNMQVYQWMINKKKLR